MPHIKQVVKCPLYKHAVHSHRSHVSPWTPRMRSGRIATGNNLIDHANFARQVNS